MNDELQILRIEFIIHRSAFIVSSNLRSVYARDSPVFMRNRATTTDADGVAGNDNRRWKLLALEFIRRRFDFV